ncbi:hypothetical protein HRbin27_00214 [bacterium HR27]|nr:hypothetical protein HRbin27_00214 [bacterium HR27]
MSTEPLRRQVGHQRLDHSGSDVPAVAEFVPDRVPFDGIAQCQATNRHGVARVRPGNDWGAAARCAPDRQGRSGYLAENRSVIGRHGARPAVIQKLRWHLDRIGALGNGAGIDAACLGVLHAQATQQDFERRPLVLRVVLEPGPLEVLHRVVLAGVWIPFGEFLRNRVAEGIEPAVRLPVRLETIGQCVAGFGEIPSLGIVVRHVRIELNRPERSVVPPPLSDPIAEERGEDGITCALILRVVLEAGAFEVLHHHAVLREGFGDRVPEGHQPTVTDPCPEKIAAQVVPSLGEVQNEPMPVRGMRAAGERRERHQQECEREEHTEGELETARHPRPLPYPAVCRHAR